MSINSASTDKRKTFGGSLGFVLAAAGSAVGLGNIWRFPYLAAKDGGGLFLVIYIILALTFGFTLLTTEIAIGRKTQQSPLTAYSQIKKGWKPLGILGCLVPVIIMPYYCVIGGWVLKYLVVFVTGKGAQAAGDDYFTGFIGQITMPIVFMLIFLVACAFFIYRGVNKGIEKMAKIIMPALVIMVIAIAIFSLTISFPDENGVTRTGLQGLKEYVVPNLTELGFNQGLAPAETFKIASSKIITTVVDALGQLFFSLSVAMGIMIAYGSYVSRDANLVKSINQIEIFDTVIAFLAGVMIIPAVYVFQGREGMAQSGPGLMFVSLPQVFEQMGAAGNVVGAIFFAMVLFAAVTSGVSIMEAIVSSFMDEFKISRTKATAIETGVAAVVGVVVCLGFNLLSFGIKLPNSNKADAGILDILDYASNNILMPIVAIGTCILIGWIVKPKTIIDECERNGEKMGRKLLYNVMIKVIAPILLIVILLRSLGIIKI